jgi:hypothetical protein
MTLTLRPTHLSRDPDRNDWSVHDDGQDIGRQCEDLTATRAELRWRRMDGRRRWSRPRLISGRNGRRSSGQSGAPSWKAPEPRAFVQKILGLSEKYIVAL